MTTETSIQCDCPHCGRVCGFKADYAGRTARCLHCDTRFVVPQKTGLPAVPCPAAAAGPRAGFYANAFKGGLGAFIHPESRTGLVFCAALVVFHFFLGNEDLSFTLPGFRPPMLIGWAVTLVTFGCFAWYSLEIITAARLGVDSLPRVEPGAGLEFLWLVIKSCYLFFVSLVIALLPASVISAVLESFGIALGRLYYLIAAICLLFWPINLAVIALEVPFWRMFRYDLLAVAIVKTFVPFLFTAVVTLTAFSVVWMGMGYFITSETITTTAAFGLLGLRLAGAFFFLFAMRIIGVYVLHYAEVCPALWLTPAPQRSAQA